MPISRNLTSSLKGLAIMSVILGHFSHAHLPRDAVEFLGNHFVSFFFVLSGLGLFYSLDRMDKTKTALARYYYKRFVRIYPLYWLFYLSNLFLLEEGHFRIVDFLLLHYSKPTSVWFLHALIPCYVFSPILYWIAKKKNLFFHVAIVAFFICANFVLPELGVPSGRCWTYRSIYFGNFILFYAGMLFARFPVSITETTSSKIAAVLFVLMLFVFIETSGMSLLGMNTDHLVFSVLIYAASLAFVFFFIHGRDLPRAFSFLGLIGIYTFGLYLFEGAYNIVLTKTGVISGRNWVNLGVWLAIFPVFFLGTGFLEEMFANKLHVMKSVRSLKAKVVNSFR